MINNDRQAKPQTADIVEENLKTNYTVRAYEEKPDQEVMMLNSWYKEKINAESKGENSDEM